MINISGNTITPDDILKDYDANRVERKIIDILYNSEKVYMYSSLGQLRFEVKLRFYIVKASVDLYRSRFKFRVFRKSYCNEDFWERTDDGGFLIRDDVSSSRAISDIYINSRKYGSECATAIVIVFYKAVKDIFPEETFNMLFPKIHLMNWHFIDSDLNITYYPEVIDQLPGDCIYIKNPDVDPSTPEWQGENAIVLGNGDYYGHGIGIKSLEEMIYSLNKHRKEGATESAYLLESSTRLDFKKLYTYY